MRTNILYGVMAAVALAILPAARAQPGATDVVATASAKGTQITVSGTGEVERKPDFAVVSVGVQARKDSARGASEQVGEVMKKVNKALGKLNIEGMQVQTSGVMLNPAYVWNQINGEQTQKLVGYDATSTLRVRVDDPEKIGAVIDAAIDAGANRINGISFELKGALEARQEAITMAAGAAREKADTLAAALGLRIIGVVSATTGSDGGPVYPMMSNEVAFARSAPGMGESIKTGVVTVRAEATVTFLAEALR